MNVEEVRAIVHDRFGEVAQLREAVFKASSRMGDTPFSLWVFDCTQSVATTGFDLQAYQDELLRDEFYRVTGSLQWNLYCCFLCDEDRLAGLETSGTVAAIERDTTYARKFVRTPAMLRDDFASLAAIATPATSDLPQDIAAIWKQKLDANGLAAVYSDLSYIETVRRVKVGESGAETWGDGNTTTVQPDLRVDAIGAIDLDCFPHQRPIRRQYEFGQCNLIYGANGAGKTSLLEGIEAWICGRNRRNYDIPIPENCMNIRLRGSSEWQPGPVANPTLYRQRDHAWYGNYQARRNDLCYNFARFSFFDADAAARLEITSDHREIEHALSHLVLGEAAAKIAERMDKILSMLQTEEGVVSRTIRNAQELIQSASDSIASLQVPTETLKHAYEQLVEQLRSVGWRADPSLDSADGCLALLASLNSLKARVESLLVDLPWIERPSISDVEREREALAACTAGIESVRQLIPVLKNYQKESERNAEEYGKWGELLQRYLAYSQAGAIILLDSAGELERLEQRKKSLTKAAQALGNIDISQFEGVKETGGDMAVRVQHDLEQHSENLAKARQIVASLESVQGRMQALLAEIRSRAEELLSFAPATSGCPVCGATYEEGELLERLQHQAKHDAAPELQRAHSELANLQKQHEGLSRILRDLDTLQSIGRDVVGLPSPATEPVSRLVGSIMLLERGIAQCDIDISRLKHNRDQLQAKGFSVEELLHLNRELSHLSKEASLGDESQLCRLLEEMESKQKEAAAHVVVCAKGLVDAEEKIQAVLTQYAADGDATVEIVATRMSKLSGTIERFGELSESLTVDVDRSLADVAVDLDSLRQSVEGLIRLKQQEESVAHVISANQNKIAVLKDTLARERPVWDRLKSAITVIEELKSEYSAEKYLQGFFSENLHQISDLFCAMHAPRDFCNVVWRPDSPMAIQAVRKHTGEPCSVAELSSGQRNALALAIFLTMNRKITQAPSLILLDDPVAHVDDLNIVSFFDCLRELLPGCNRQVFFATASAKTAHLFARKFDYLGDEVFKSFPLTP